EEETGEPLDDKYFTQTLLPDYLNEFPEETADWDVVFDARGHLVEPHTRVQLPLGTLEVRQFLADVAKEHRLAGKGKLPPRLRLKLKTSEFHGPDLRFAAVMFVEKEGFMPLFRAANLAERFDLCIISTKGVSTTASRLLVESLCAEYGLPLLILRDFDKA